MKSLEFILNLPVIKGIREKMEEGKENRRIAGARENARRSGDLFDNYMEFVKTVYPGGNIVERDGDLFTSEGRILPKPMFYSCAPCDGVVKGTPDKIYENGGIDYRCRICDSLIYSESVKERVRI